MTTTTQPKGVAIDIDDADETTDVHARALRADAKRNRIRIIEAALEKFASAGASATIDTIANEAGVGVGTIYRHFPTKEALLEAVIRHRVNLLAEEAECLCDSCDPGSAFFSFMVRLVEEGTKKRDLANALCGEGCDVFAGASDITATLQGGLTALLERAKSVGAVRDDIVIGDLIGLLAGACLLTDEHVANTDTARRVFEIMCDGLRPRAGT